jgi:hypothetical protein
LTEAGEGKKNLKLERKKECKVGESKRRGRRR